MDDQWYFAVGGKNRGPVSQNTLRKLLAEGRLSNDDLVWHQGMDAWAPAESVLSSLGKRKRGAKPDLEEVILPRRESIACPMGGEEVLAVAKKCKHCGETLDVALRAAEEARRMAEHAAQRPHPQYALHPASGWNPGV